MKFEVQKYFEISTIHGLVYITKRYHLVERIFWIISLIISVTCTLILIVELFTKLWNFPIVTYISDQSIPVSEINLPAITVCPRIIYNDGNWDIKPRYRYEKHTVKKIKLEFEESKLEFADQERFGNITYLEFLDRIENGSIKPEKLGINTLKTLQVLDMISDRGLFSKLNFSIPADDFLNNINEFQKEFAYHPFSLYILLVRQIQEYISEIITPWGLCFTYNVLFSHDLLNINETSEDFHYEYVNKMFRDIDIEAPPTDLPYKLSTSKAGLWIGIYNPVAPLNDYLEYEFDGYMVFFHSPYELPSKSSKVLKFNRQLQTMIWIDPTIRITDESLMEYEPAERNCYLEDEKVLKFFKVYTKNNCEQECLSNFMLNRCGCVAFFVIRNSTTRICSASERNCFKQAEEDFEEHKSFCECFEPCEYVHYGFEVVTAGFIDTQARNSMNNKGFMLQYKSNEIKEQTRKKQFTILDILSFVGGILGLFVGFSALSFVELVYWFTIRVWMANYKRTGTKVSPVNEDQGSNSRLMEAKAYFLSYFAESSIHGLGHISEFSWIISMIWTTLILTTMSLCLHLVLSARDSVPDSRVIAYDDSFKSIDNIPFPAITIVPIYSFIDSYSNVFATMSPEASRKFVVPKDYPEEDFRRFSAQRFFCQEAYNSYDRGFNFSFVPYIYLTVFLNSQLYWFMEQFTAFNGKYQPKYAHIRTSRGAAFTFNMMESHEILNFKHISSNFNYTRDVTTEPQNLQKFPSFQKYPLKFKKSDRVEFTAVMTKPRENFDKCIKQSFMVHEPNYLPTFSVRKDFILFDYGTIVDVIVTPEITRTDDSLRRISPTERGCYFEGEKQLHYFNAYSQRNCEIECITNATVQKCGCVHIDQPHLEDEEVCLNISSFQNRIAENCLIMIQNDVYLSSDQSISEACACLPLCNSISYNIDYHTTYDTYETDVSFVKWQRHGNEVTINVRMNMDDIILYRRYQQFTFSDVVSYVGGLLGLFAGISMLSIVEFFYFFTIRLGVNLWRGLKLRWCGFWKF